MAGHILARYRQIALCVLPHVVVGASHLERIPTCTKQQRSMPDSPLRSWSAPMLLAVPVDGGQQQSRDQVRLGFYMCAHLARLRRQRFLDADARVLQPRLLLVARVPLHLAAQSVALRRHRLEPLLHRRHLGLARRLRRFQLPDRRLQLLVAQIHMFPGFDELVDREFRLLACTLRLGLLRVVLQKRHATLQRTAPSLDVLELRRQRVDCLRQLRALRVVLFAVVRRQRVQCAALVLDARSKGVQVAQHRIRIVSVSSSDCSTTVRWYGLRSNSPDSIHSSKARSCSWKNCDAFQSSAGSFSISGELDASGSFMGTTRGRLVLPASVSVSVATSFDLDLLGLFAVALVGGDLLRFGLVGDRDVE